MGFNDHVVKAIQQAKWNRSDLIEKIQKINHECDCEFCTVQEDMELEEVETVEKLEKDLVSLEADIKRMEKYALDHGLIKEKVKS